MSAGASRSRTADAARGGDAELTLKAAAEMTGCPGKVLRRYIREGRLKPASMDGNRMTVTLAALRDAGLLPALPLQDAPVAAPADRGDRDAEERESAEAARAAERAEREKAEREAKEAAARAAAAAQAKAEAEARERAERERNERARAEKAEREKADRERAEREAREKAEREKSERARVEREKAERAQREKSERARAEKAAAEREKAERDARERAERERVEREKADRARAEAEARRKERERAEAEAEKVRAEAEAREKAEAAKVVPLSRPKPARLEDLDDVEVTPESDEFDDRELDEIEEELDDLPANGDEAQTVRLQAETPRAERVVTEVRGEPLPAERGLVVAGSGPFVTSNQLADLMRLLAAEREARAQEWMDRTEGLYREMLDAQRARVAQLEEEAKVLQGKLEESLRLVPKGENLQALEQMIRDLRIELDRREAARADLEHERDRLRDLTDRLRNDLSRAEKRNLEMAEQLRRFRAQGIFDRILSREPDDR